jgi:hypothetical protein
MDTSFFFSCAKSVVCGVPNIRKTIAQWKKGGSIQEKSETPGEKSHYNRGQFKKYRKHNGGSSNDATL